MCSRLGCVREAACELTGEEKPATYTIIRSSTVLLYFWGGGEGLNRTSSGRNHPGMKCSATYMRDPGQDTQLSQPQLL